MCTNNTTTLSKDDLEEGQTDHQGEAWVKDATTEDNERYRMFLQYMEDRREEIRIQKEEDDERKEQAKRKEESWDLMRRCITYLKENGIKWRERRIRECDMIREEEKRDRLAVVRVKKRKYGLKKLSKEENKRMTLRTEERLEIAKVKENLWRRHRGEGKTSGMGEEEEEAWEILKQKVEELEEKEGAWKTQERTILVNIRQAKLTKEMGGQGSSKPAKEDEVGVSAMPRVKKASQEAGDEVGVTAKPRV